MTIGKNEIARRYANAAFNEAISKNIYENFSADLSILKKIFDDEKKIYRFFISPIVNYKDKINIFNELNFSLFTNNFLAFLLKINRFSLIKMIIENLKIIELKKDNKIEAELISCLALNETEINYISKILENYFNCKIIILPKIDSDILGGFIIKIKGKIIDLSLATKLKNLRNNLNFESLIL